MAIGYMIGIVLSNGKRTLFRDPRAKAEEERPGAVFSTPTAAMLALPEIPWRKYGDRPDDIHAYGRKGEIYYLLKIDTSILFDPAQLRRPPTKLTREVI